MRAMTPTVTRRVLLGGLAALGAGTAFGMHSAFGSTAVRPAASTSPIRVDLLEPTGIYDIGMTELHLVDHGRRDPWTTEPGVPRELMLSVWYPAERGSNEPPAPYMRSKAAATFDAGASGILRVPPGTVDWAGFGTHARAGAPVATGTHGRPVVLYSPGMFNERTLDTVAVAELASGGYIVVTVDHTHEAHAVEFPDGRVAEPSPVLTGIEPAAERTRAALDVRVADIRFVLDQLQVLARGGNPDAERRRLPRGLGRALDLSRTGMFGHSLGGMTTAEAMRLDRRIRAGANLDGPMGYDWVDPALLLPVARSGLDRPFLQMGAWLYAQSSRLPHTHEHSPSWKSLWERSKGWKRDLWAERAEHNSFTDYQTIIPALAEHLELPEGLRARMIGTVDPQRFVTSRRAYLAAFFDQHLRNQRQPLLDGPSPHHPDIQFVGT